MCKLIDAGALADRLDSMMSESSNAVSLSAIIALAVVKGTLIPDMPDASEPLRLDAARTMQRLEDRNTELRKRIAELEGIIRKILTVQSLTQTRLTHDGRCQAIHELAEAMNEAEALLKGAQDA